MSFSWWDWPINRCFSIIWIYTLLSFIFSSSSIHLYKNDICYTSLVVNVHCYFVGVLNRGKSRLFTLEIVETRKITFLKQRKVRVTTHTIQFHIKHMLNTTLNTFLIYKRHTYYYNSCAYVSALMIVVKTRLCKDLEKVYISNITIHQIHIYIHHNWGE